MCWLSTFPAVDFLAFVAYSKALTVSCGAHQSHKPVIPLISLQAARSRGRWQPPPAKPWKKNTVKFFWPPRWHRGVLKGVYPLR